MTQEIRTPDDAELKRWVMALTLLLDECTSELEYAQATDFCSDCPRRDDGREYACCRETGEFDERYEKDWQYVENINRAILAIRALVKDLQ
jgi:hypothetical protein